jgi:hypothetical protein
LKKQQEIHTRLALERKIFLRDRKIKFFGNSFSFFNEINLFTNQSHAESSKSCPLFCLERRKIERRTRRLEKLQRASSGQAAQDVDLADQLSKLKEDLEYVRVSCSARFLHSNFSPFLR